MKIVILVKLPVRPRVSKIHRFHWLHCHEYLYQRKYSRENTLTRILLNLVISLAHRYSASFKFYMNNRHPVNEQHQVSLPIVHNSFCPLVLRLLHYLVPALSRCDLVSVINLKAHLFAKMQHVLRVIPRYGNRFTINKPVQLKWSSQFDNLLYDLLHLALRQSHSIKPVDISIILEKNSSPVVQQIDRKSTRLNSSHVRISYAVFCLKKKNK